MELSPDYADPLVQGALRDLASIDLIELCNEAKVQHCRAIKDLSSCGRLVKHVLVLCGHASLCAECCHILDMCPICRMPLSDGGERVHLRLYYKCIEAGLISREHDDYRMQSKDVNAGVSTDVLRLYSIFDVALQNNLSSLICQYVTDVCMDEEAISSDPITAFVLDEVVIKDWCKQTVVGLITEIKEIYRFGAKTMQRETAKLQKLVVHLNGVSHVLEVMVSMFKETLSAQVYDLHQLLENTAKVKQHLEVMMWCIQHNFLENVQSRYPDTASWNSHFLEIKSAAAKRKWSDSSSNCSNYTESKAEMLFIEEALRNLGIEQCCLQKHEEDVDATCLRRDVGHAYPVIEHSDGYCYPFKDLRAAADMLFLYGTSDMMVAKQATFLYYLIDRHWTRPEYEWKYIVDDFAATFGIMRCDFLECFMYCLLDDSSSDALKVAVSILPTIASAESHPRIAQVFLENQLPDVALTVLRCTGLETVASMKNEQGSALCLDDAVTAVRVRVEYGLLTEAFMYQRAHCLVVRGAESEHHVAVLVTEICTLCAKNNLLDRMIELPWNSEEEKHIQKYLYNDARREPCTFSGSFLVVFYLQRFQYSKAYRINCELHGFEESAERMRADDEKLSRMRSISQWRQDLVNSSIRLLPEVERQEVLSNRKNDSVLLFGQDALTTHPVLPTASSTILEKLPSHPRTGPSVLQHKLFVPAVSPTPGSVTRPNGGISLAFQTKDHQRNLDKTELMRFNPGSSHDTPLKLSKKRSTPFTATKLGSSHESKSVGRELLDFFPRSDNSAKSIDPKTTPKFMKGNDFFPPKPVEVADSKFRSFGSRWRSDDDATEDDLQNETSASMGSGVILNSSRRLSRLTRRW